MKTSNFAILSILLFYTHSTVSMTTEKIPSANAKSAMNTKVINLLVQDKKYENEKQKNQTAVARVKNLIGQAESSSNFTAFCIFLYLAEETLREIQDKKDEESLRDNIENLFRIKKNNFFMGKKSIIADLPPKTLYGLQRIIELNDPDALDRSVGYYFYLSQDDPKPTRFSNILKHSNIENYLGTKFKDYYLDIRKN